MIGKARKSGFIIETKACQNRQINITMWKGHLSSGFVEFLSYLNIFSLKEEDNSKVSSIIYKMRYCFYPNFYRNLTLCVRFIVSSIVSHSLIRSSFILSALFKLAYIFSNSEFRVICFPSVVPK